MTGLSAAVEDYLRTRRALGHQLEQAERLLGQFQAYVDQTGVDRITTDVAVAWATLPVGASAAWWAQRLGVVRGFAAWFQTLEPRTEVPPTDLLTGRFRRAVPYLYSDADITAMMHAAQGLPIPFQRHTYETLIGLLAVTGLRVGEAIRLDREDVRLGPGILRVTNSKFNKSREVPLHPSTVDALDRYARLRDQLCPAPTSPSFFLNTLGTRLSYTVVHPTFKKLTRQAGLQARTERCRPRIHDVRHSFAVRALADCYATNGNVHSLLPLLSVFLGHSDPKFNLLVPLGRARARLAHASRRLEDAFEHDSTENA